MADEIIYAVDIRLQEGSGVASVAPGAGGSSDYLRQTAEGITKMERLFTKPGSIFSTMGGLGGGGGIAAAIGTGIAGAVAAWMIPRAILQNEFNKLDAAIARNKEARAENRAVLDSPEVKEDQAMFERMDKLNDTAKISDIFARAGKEMNEILKDNIISQEEILRLKELEEEVNAERHRIATELVSQADQEGFYTQKIRDQHTAILDLQAQIFRLRQQSLGVTQQNANAVHSETAAYEEQLRVLTAIAKKKDSKGRTTAEVFKGDQSIGEFTGKTYTAQEAKALGYSSAMGAGSNGVFVGVRTVA